MKDLLSECLLLCIVSTVLLTVINSGSKLKKQAGTVLSIVCVIAVLNAMIYIYSAVKKFDVVSFLDIDYQYKDMTIDIQRIMLDKTDEELRSSISSVARSKFDIPIESDRIYIVYDTSDFQNVGISKVTIDLKNVVTIKNVNELKNFIAELLYCECEVIGV